MIEVKKQNKKDRIALFGLTYTPDLTDTKLLESTPLDRVLRSLIVILLSKLSPKISKLIQKTVATTFGQMNCNYEKNLNRNI